MHPLAFVVMPFGTKPNPAGGPAVQFDAIYADGITPALAHAGLDPLRADGERGGGFIDRDMYERLLLCDYAIADLTTSNPNVFYELGVRHAVRPHTTLMIFAKGPPLPFDVAHLRALPYELAADGRLADPAAFRAELAARMRELVADRALDPKPDSPLFTVLAGYRAPDLAHLATDTFRDRVRLDEADRLRLAAARRDEQPNALRAVEADLLAAPVESRRLATLVDLFLSWRGRSGWQEMVDLYPRLPGELRHRVMLREQLGFALNRLGRRDEAAEVLESVINEIGPNPETNGILGRVWKDRWQDAQKAGDKVGARAALRKAIDVYDVGFEADCRDFYPGVNAVTLMELEGSPAFLARQAEVLPVVRFALAARARRRVGLDYWDHATALELTVLASNAAAAEDALLTVRAASREAWDLETTANNLRLIRDARAARGVDVAWLEELIAGLVPSR